MKQARLSKLQRTTLDVLAGEKDWVPLRWLTFQVASRYTYTKGRRGVISRDRKIKDLWQMSMMGKITDLGLDYQLNKLYRSRKRETITEKFLASFSRSLRNLEEKGIVKLEPPMKDWREWSEENKRRLQKLAKQKVGTKHARFWARHYERKFHLLRRQVSDVKLIRD